MVAGIAFSGGGVTACVCTLCYLKALSGYTGEETLVSTVSGGTLGVLLFENAPKFRNLTFPETDPRAATYETLSSARANDGETWFAEIVREIPSAAEVARGVPSAAEVGTVYGWWESALDAAALSAYEVEPWSLEAGERPWIVGAALLDESAAPIRRDERGVYGSAGASLHPVEIEMNAPRPELSTPGLANVSVALPDDFSIMNAASFSSAFWAAAVVESEVEFELLKSQLVTLPSESRGTQVVLDGAEAASASNGAPPTDREAPVSQAASSTRPASSRSSGGAPRASSPSTTTTTAGSRRSRRPSRRSSASTGRRTR